MNDISFTIANDQKDQYLKISNDPTLKVLSSMNRTRDGYLITLSAVGGHEGDVAQFIDLLRSSGFDI